MHLLKSKFLFSSLSFGAAVALIVTVVICVWEWIENPGGIFRGDDGTNWGFVFDTATSWLVPTFFYAVVFALLAQLILKIFGVVGRKLSKSKSARREP